MQTVPSPTQNKLEEFSDTVIGWLWKIDNYEAWGAKLCHPAGLKIIRIFFDKVRFFGNYAKNGRYFLGYSRGVGENPGSTTQKKIIIGPLRLLLRKGRKSRKIIKTMRKL